MPFGVRDRAILHPLYTDGMQRQELSSPTVRHVDTTPPPGDPLATTPPGKCTSATFASYYDEELEESGG